jgi:hypothetical protein
MRPWNLTKQNLPFLIEKIKSLDFSHRWKVIVYQESDKRSNEQNERLWGYLYTSIGNHFGYRPDEIHEMCKYKFLKREIVIEDEVIPVVKSTSKLTVQEFTDYMRNIETWAAQHGWSAD